MSSLTARARGALLLPRLVAVQHPAASSSTSSRTIATAASAAAATTAARCRQHSFATLTSRHRALFFSPSFAHSRILAHPLSTSTQRPLAAAAAAAAADSSTSFADAEAILEEDDLNRSFNSLKLSSAVKRAVTRSPFNYTTMSEVQSRVLPLLPELAAGSTATAPMPDGQGGRDLLVKAKTGTGKTLAFLIPAIEARLKAIDDVSKGIFPPSFVDLLKRNRPDVDLSNPSSLPKKELDILTRQFCNNSVGALILSPTRELATQIATEARKLVTHVRPEMGVQLLVGGVSKDRQLRDWSQSRPDIVVATPGRIQDVLQDKAMVREAASATQTLVLDEADTLLEMGFRQEIQSILQYLPEAGGPSSSKSKAAAAESGSSFQPQHRHTMLFSATVSTDIRQIARASLAKDHRFIDCVPAGEENTHKHIPQFATVVPSADQQLPYVLNLIAHDQLTHPGKSKVIVFTPTTRMTMLVGSLLGAMRRYMPTGAGSRVYEIHSKKDQNQRFRTSDGFRKDQSGGSILVTSDVSARGVDYPGTTRVIQIGCPSSADQYIHRIGRTGRAGAKGRADLVLLPFEDGFLQWQLDDLPVQTLGVQDLQQQLMELAQQHDKDPSSFIPSDILRLMREGASGTDSRRGGKGFRQRQPPPKMLNYSLAPAPLLGPLAPKLEPANIEERVHAFMTDDSAGDDGEGGRAQELREVFMSQLGFYVGLAPELRTSKHSIMQALKEWCKDVGKLEQEPYLSPRMLDNLGLSKPDNGGWGGKSGGRGGGGYGSRSGRRDDRGSRGRGDRDSYSFRDRGSVAGSRSGGRFSDRGRAPRSRDGPAFGNRGGFERRERTESTPRFGA